MALFVLHRRLMRCREPGHRVTIAIQASFGRKRQPKPIYQENEGAGMLGG